MYGGNVAEGNAAKKVKEEAPAENQDAGQGKDRKSLILGILVVVNSLAFAAVGFGLYQYSKATRSALSEKTEISEAPAAEGKEQGGGHGGGHGAAGAADDHDKKGEQELKLVALETFYVNLDGSEGYKLLKVTMSLEVENAPTQEEITKRQAQVRDMIIILLTSKKYGEVSGENAQDKLKAEIIDTVNSILTKGKIKKILFTEFLFQ